MWIALDQPPTDTDVLRRLVRDMASALDSRQSEIERLRQIIVEFKRARFGRSAERLDPGQASVTLEQLETDLAAAVAAAPAVEPSAPSHPATSPHRGPLPAHLPRAETVLPVLHKRFHINGAQTAAARCTTRAPPAARCWTESRLSCGRCASPGPNAPAVPAAPCIRHLPRSG